MTVAGQLELFVGIETHDIPMTIAEAGVRRAIPGGPGRLVTALVKDGLDPADLVAACALAIALDEAAKP